MQKCATLVGIAKSGKMSNPLEKIGFETSESETFKVSLKLKNPGTRGLLDDGVRASGGTY